MRKGKVAAVADAAMEWGDGAKAAVRLVAAGDVCPIGGYEALFASPETEKIFDSGIRDLFRKPNLVLANLEAPLCTVEEPIRKIGPNFRVTPKAAEGLHAAGIGLVTLANNHILDQGPKGLAETVAALEARGIAHHGAHAGHAAARAPCTMSAGGLRIAFLAFAEGEFSQSQGEGPGAARLDPVENARDIRQARREHDCVIVSIHGGNEHQPFPSPRTRDAYRALAEAGAHLVLANHPHIPQGIERHAGVPIVYSMGNFVFDYGGHAAHAETRTGFLVEAGLARGGVVSMELHPYRRGPGLLVSLLSGAQRARFLAYMDRVSRPLPDTERLQALWEQEVVRLYESGYAGLMERTADLLSMDDAKRRWTESLFFNLWRCDAHAEAMKTAFRLKHEDRFSRDAAIQAELDSLMAALAAMAGEGA